MTQRDNKKTEVRVTKNENTNNKESKSIET